MESHHPLLYACFWNCWLIIVLYGETIRLEIHGDRGRIQTPNYPAPYPINFTSLWSIRGPRGSVLQLNFTDFDVEANKICLYDYVSISIGEGQETSKFCGAKIPPGVTAASGSILIKFVSDATTARRGFKAKWSALPTGDRSYIPTHSVIPTECKTRHVVTVTDSSCPEHSTETVAVKSCHCPSRSSVFNKYSPSTSKVVTQASFPTESDQLPVKPIAGVDVQNNTVTEKCAQERDKQIDDSKTESNQRLVIILGALTAVFFFTDVLMIMLWYCRYKRSRENMAHNCRTELPPIELKIVDGKVVSSPRRAGPRVKFSDDNCLNGKSVPHRTLDSRPQFNDGNENIKGSQGIDLITDSRYADQNESSQLVVTDQSH